MPIRILAIGKKHEDWILHGIERYEKRLRQPFAVEWLLLPHSSRAGDTARQEESGRILERIKPNEYVILLDEQGKLFDSPSFSKLLLSSLEQSRLITLVVGGAYGVDGRVHARANTIWSLSPLVFPHQLARLLIIEQVYRAQEIAAGRAYHHE